MYLPFRHLSTRRIYSQLTATIGRHPKVRYLAYKRYLRYAMLPEESPTLSKTPCRMAYIKFCKCWKLHPYVHLVPNDPNGNLVKGSLDKVVGQTCSALMDQELDVGDVSVSSNGLLYPETACRSTSRRSVPSADVYSPSMAWCLVPCKRKCQVLSLLQRHQRLYRSHL